MVGVILGHDFLLEFGGCLAARVVLVVEVRDAFLDCFADIDGLLREFELRLQDVDALLDDRLPAEDPSLLGCGVRGQDRLSGTVQELLAVAELIECASIAAGESLDGGLWVEKDSCHSDERLKS